MNITVQASELPGTLRVVPLLHLAGALSAPAHAQSGSVVLTKTESPHWTILVSDNTVYHPQGEHARLWSRLLEDLARGLAACGRIERYDRHETQGRLRS